MPVCCGISGPGLLRAGEHAAGGHYVFAPAGAYGGGDAHVVEAVAKLLHALDRTRLEVAARYGVEADEIDAAVKPFEQAPEGSGGSHVGVDSIPHDVFDR